MLWCTFVDASISPVDCECLKDKAMWWDSSLYPLKLPDMLGSSSSQHSSHDMPLSRETRCWDKRSDFIWKASRLTRWWIHALKHHLNSGSIANSFYTRGRGSKKGSRLGVTEGYRHGHQRGSKESWEAPCPWSVDPHRHSSDYGIPKILWQGNHYFHMYFPTSWRRQAGEAAICRHVKL